MNWLKWTSVVIVGGVLVVVVLYGVSRWLGASAEQERALVLMEGGIAPIGRDPFAPPSIDVETGQTQARLNFDQGRTQAAFERVCRDIVAWRSAGAGARDLFVYMDAARAVDASSLFFAQLLAQSPVDQQLPPGCRDALAPPRADELSLCEAFRGELAQTRTVELPSNLFFDRRMTDARMASGLAQACDGPLQQAVVEDRPLPPLAISPRFGFDCIRNPTGCILVDIALPAYQDYVQRAQEHGARMRLASTVYWLHAEADATRPLAERLAARPVALRSPGHPVEVVDGWAGLRIRTFRPMGHWQLPLAAVQGQAGSVSGTGSASAQ